MERWDFSVWVSGGKATLKYTDFTCKKYHNLLIINDNNLV
nr:MAG TPA: hypothetical protein [Caudoviricetes sp.]